MSTYINTPLRSMSKYGPLLILAALCIVAAFISGVFAAPFLTVIETAR